MLIFYSFIDTVLLVIALSLLLHAVTPDGITAIIGTYVQRVDLLL